MTEIVPDTSKYDDLPNKLRALAAIMESDQPVQHCDSDPRWGSAAPDATIAYRVKKLESGKHNYRSKPKPRELWVSFNRNGTIFEASKSPVTQLPGTTVVRFVEQPE